LTVLDTVLVPKVEVILNKYGIQATYFSTPLRVYNPATGNVLVGDNTGVLVTVSPPQQFSKKFDGENVRYDDLGVYMLPSIIPEVGNKLEVNAVTYQIIMVFPLYTGLLIAAYKLQLRK